MLSSQIMALLDFDFVCTRVLEFLSQAMVHRQTELHPTCPSTHNGHLPRMHLEIRQGCWRLHIILSKLSQQRGQQVCMQLSYQPESTPYSRRDLRGQGHVCSPVRVLLPLRGETMCGREGVLAQGSSL